MGAAMSVGFHPLLRFPLDLRAARRCSGAWPASGTPLLHRRFQWLLITDRVPVCLPSSSARPTLLDGPAYGGLPGSPRRSEEHTSELQSHLNLVCRLLLEKKKNRNKTHRHKRRAHV